MQDKEQWLFAFLLLNGLSINETRLWITIFAFIALGNILLWERMYFLCGRCGNGSKIIILVWSIARTSILLRVKHNALFLRWLSKILSQQMDSKHVFPKIGHEWGHSNIDGIKSETVQVSCMQDDSCQSEKKNHIFLDHDIYKVWDLFSHTEPQLLLTLIG